MNKIVLFKLGYEESRLGFWETGLFGSLGFGLIDHEIKEKFYEHVKEL